MHYMARYLMLAAFLGGFVFSVRAVHGYAPIACNEAALADAIHTGGNVELLSDCQIILTADLPTISSSLTINGNGATIDGRAHRIFSAPAAQDVTLKSLTIKGGKNVYGGGLFAMAGNVTIEHCTFSANAAGLGGGAIYAGTGNVKVNDSNFMSNTAGYGGGIAALKGTVAIKNSVFSDNTASSRGGGAVWVQEGMLNITQGTFSGNKAGYRGGGGIYVGQGRANISLSKFTKNVALSGPGGGLNLDSNLNFSSPEAPDIDEKKATISGSLFAGNSAANGGGLATGRNNVDISATTFAENVALGDGGGIYSGSRVLNISNSTFSANKAAIGGGIDAGYSTIKVVGSTISENVAEKSSGIHVDATLILQQSIVAANKGNTGGDIAISEYGKFDPRGYNLIGKDDGKLALGKSNIVNVAPGLEPFDGQVYRLKPGSPALDAVPPDQCAITTDQLGMTRPQGSGCDIGAIEMPQAPSPAGTRVVASMSTISPTTTPAPTATLPPSIACSESALRTGLKSGGVIELAPKCVYTLTSNLDEFVQGTVINGNGAVIDGKGHFQIFGNAAGVTVRNLILQNGLQKNTGQSTYWGRWKTTIMNYTFPALAATRDPINDRAITANNAGRLIELSHHGTFRYTDTVAFSPDSSMIAVGTSEDTTLWAIRDGKLISLWKLPIWSVSLAFSPDGKSLATADLSVGYDINLREVSSGKILATLTGHKDSIYGLAFSPDGYLLASSDRQSIIKLWDLKTSTFLADLIGHRELYGLTFSPDGKYLISAGDTVRTWDTKTFDVVKVFDTSVAGLAFSSDAKLLASGTRTIVVGDDKELEAIQLYDPTTGQNVAILEAQSDEFLTTTFSSDSTLMAGASVDGRLVVWDIATMQPVAMVSKPSFLLDNLHFSPDGTLLVAGKRDEKGEIILWGLKSR